MTPDEADEALRRAILHHAAAHGLSDVVAHWQKVVEDGQSRYTMHYARNPTPTHIAAGLFSTAARMVLDGGDE